MLHFRSPTFEADLPVDLPPMLTAWADPDLAPMPASVFAQSGIDPAALVETARGPVAARELVAGDRLVTRDKGLQPLRWCGEQTAVYAADSAERPGPMQLRLAQPGGPANSANGLRVAPGQRLLIRNALNAVLFATDEVLAAAADLGHIDGIDPARLPNAAGPVHATWVHPLLDSHELILVNGVWMESFAPDLEMLRVAFPAAWREITEAMPRLKYENTAAAYVAARLSLDPQEAQLVNGL